VNFSQWDFYVFVTNILGNEISDQKTTTQSLLLILKPTKFQFGETWNAIQPVWQQWFDL